MALLRPLVVAFLCVEAQGSCSAGQFFTGYTSVPVAWTAVVNVNESGNGAPPDTVFSLEKTGGGTDDNAGAISTQEITSSSTTPQGVSFKVGAGSFVYVGFGNTNTDVGRSDIEFAVKCVSDGDLQVYESGSRKGEFGTWTATDVLKVQVVGTTIQYLKNDQVFYTSLQTPAFPLHVDTSFWEVGSKITDVEIYSASTGSTCSACPGGKYSVSPATSCSTCPDGKYSGPSDSACLSCANGTYLTAWSSETSNDNVTDCKDCLAGQFLATTGATCVAHATPTCAAGKSLTAGTASADATCTVSANVNGAPAQSAFSCASVLVVALVAMNWN
jgi:hypothetical protein